MKYMEAVKTETLIKYANDILIEIEEDMKYRSGMDINVSKLTSLLNNLSFLQQEFEYRTQKQIEEVQKENEKENETNEKGTYRGC